VNVRRIREQDWAQLREIRLEALADNQLAFAEWLADAQVQTEDRWRERAARGATGLASAQFVAETSAGRWAGITGGFHSEDRPDAVTVYFVYVRREHRTVPAGAQRQ